MADDGEKGHVEAHTPAQIGAAAPSSAEAARDPAPALPIEGDDAGELFDHALGSSDLLGSDGLSAAAELVATERRARGRPLGSLNKKNSKLFSYLAARGHRHPAVTLSLWQSADTKALAKAIGADTAKGRIAVAALQVRAAAELLPYDLAKRPQQLELPKDGTGRPLMIIGEVNGNVQVGDGGFMTAGVMPEKKPNEINGEIVRQSAKPDEG
jgi:hypothetical protein